MFSGIENRTVRLFQWFQRQIMESRSGPLILQTSLNSLKSVKRHRIGSVRTKWGLKHFVSFGRHPQSDVHDYVKILVLEFGSVHKELLLGLQTAPKSSF